MHNGSSANTQKRPVSGSAVVRIVIWSVVLLVLCTVFVLSIVGTALGGTWRAFTGFSIGGYTYEDADTYTVGNGQTTETITELDIDWVNGDIEIIPTNDTTITISEDYAGTDEDLRLRWKVEDGELKIKYRSSYWAFGIMSNVAAKKLTVQIPENMLDGMEEVDIDTVESKVIYTGNAEEFSFDSVDGHLVAIGAFGELNLDSVEARVELTGSVKAGNIDGVSITAVMHLSSAKTLDIDGVDNDVTLYLADTVTGFFVEHESFGGSATINGFSDVTTRNKDDRYWGDGSFKIDMDGVDAKLTIEKETNG